MLLSSFSGLNLLTLLEKRGEVRVGLSWNELYHSRNEMPLDFTCEHGLLRDLWLYLLGPENPPIRQE